MLDALLHGIGARLRGARRQRELQLERALVLGRQKAGGQAEEQQHEDRGDGGVDQQEDQLAIDDLFDRAGIGIGHPVEPVVEPIARGRGLTRNPAVLPLVHPALEQGRGQRGRQDQRDHHREHHRRDNRDRELAVDDAG